MRLDEVKAIIANEKLTNYNLDIDEGMHPDELVIYKKGEDWITGFTSERAGILTGSIRCFKTDEEAYDDFVKRLRSHNEIMKFEREYFKH